MSHGVRRSATARRARPLSLVTRASGARWLLVCLVALLGIAAAPGAAWAGDPPWIPVGGPALGPGQSGVHGAAVRMSDRLYTITEAGDPARPERVARVWEYLEREDRWRPVGEPLSRVDGTVRNVRLTRVGSRLHALWLEAADARGPWELRVAQLVEGDHEMVRWVPIGAPIAAIEGAIGYLEGRPLIAWVDPEGAPRAALLSRGNRWVPAAPGRLDDVVRVPGDAGGPARALEVFGDVQDAHIEWVQFDRVVGVNVDEVFGLQARENRYLRSPAPASDPPRDVASSAAPPGLSAWYGGLLAYTGPHGEIYAMYGIDFSDLTARLGLGPGRQPSVTRFGDDGYVAFVVRRRMPLGAGSVFRIVVVRYRGGFMEQLPWVDDGRLTEYGNQVNPTLVEDGDGVALVYDVQDPGFRTDHDGPRGWVTRTVRLNPDAS